MMEKNIRLFLLCFILFFCNKKTQVKTRDGTVYRKKLDNIHTYIIEQKREKENKTKYNFNIHK